MSRSTVGLTTTISGGSNSSSSTSTTTIGTTSFITSSNRSNSNPPSTSSSTNGASTGGGGGGVSGNNSKRQIFLDIVRQSNLSCQSGDFPGAIRLYTQAIKLDPTNQILYSNRSAAYIKLGQFNKALQDAIRARDLSPKWSKAYYRQGVALQCLGKHSDALAAFSTGLAQEPKSGQLLSGLIEAATKSPLQGKFTSIFGQLKSMKLEKSSFVIISVLGQELLSSGHHRSAVILLENSLKIGTTNLKLKGSVYSALSSAYWALNLIDKAIGYMQQDLLVAKSLGEISGECRAHGNLGSAYFSKGNYKEALTSHRYQLVLAMKSKDTTAAAGALTSLGHVYTSIGDYSNALASHKQCVQLLKQIGDSLQEAREIGNVGAVYLVIGDFKNALDCHLEHLRLAKELRDKVEEARALSNLGLAHHHHRNYDEALQYHNSVLEIAQELNDRFIEIRAYSGLGHAYRCLHNYKSAQYYYEKQLDCSLGSHDQINESRSLSNLGIIYQLLGDYDSSLKLHQAQLKLSLSLNDRPGLGRAYGNIGNAYNALGHFQQAIEYHKQELIISKEVSDRVSEGSTHGNLAISYQGLGLLDKALYHYHAHLNISRETKDSGAEATALLNLGNCHSSIGDFSQAVPFYENYLMISQELQDLEGEAKACHFLGFAHFSLGNFKEAVRYYDQDLSLAKELQNQTFIGRAFCNLGLTHTELGNWESALHCQKQFLNLCQSAKNHDGKFRALSNIGAIYTKMKNYEDAIGIYEKQILLAKSMNNKIMESYAYGSLGTVHRLLEKYDGALGYHSQELLSLDQTSDIKSEIRAHGNLGTVYICLKNYNNALKCFETQFQKSQELNDSLGQAQASSQIGQCKLKLGKFTEAISIFEQQLHLLEEDKSRVKIRTRSLLLEKAKAYYNLGIAYSGLLNYEKGIWFHEKALVLYGNGSGEDEIEQIQTIYSVLGQNYQKTNNLIQALNYYEKRLNLVINKISLAYESYGDLGSVYLQLKNYEQSLHYYEQQLKVSQELSQEAEAGAYSNIGRVYEGMGNVVGALQYYNTDLRVSEEIQSESGRLRAYKNIGTANEILGDLAQAKRSYENYLNIANLSNNAEGKILGYSCIGRTEHGLGNDLQAIAYLNQGLSMIEKLGNNLYRDEEESKIHHYLGLALWKIDDLESSEYHLEKSTQLLEKLSKSQLLESNKPSSASSRSSNVNSNENLLSLYDRQLGAYQALQRILVLRGKTDQTLLYAEKSRTIHNSTLFFGSSSSDNYKKFPNPFNSIETLVDKVNKLRAAVLYFSISGGYLYSWLLIPGRGIVKFNESCIGEDELSDDSDDGPKTMGGLIEKYVHGTRDSLGLESDVNQYCDDGGSDILWSQHLEELGDKLNQENDKTGFLRLLSRNHRFNSSSYSLSSLFSVGSIKSLPSTISGANLGNIRGNVGGSNGKSSHSSSWKGPKSLRSLYQLLISPFEDELSLLDQTCYHELILVVEKELLLVPFTILRNSASDEYLCEKFKLILVPSLSFEINTTNTTTTISKKTDNSTSFLIAGNPKLPESLYLQFGWKDSVDRAENEGNMISEILETVTGPGKSLRKFFGSKCTKESILNEIANAELIHFSTIVSWKLSGIVLGPEMTNSPPDTQHPTTPGFSEYLLTAADILQLSLHHTKLIVLSSCHTKEGSELGNWENISSLCCALLGAGAKSILVTLWPVPETSSKIFFRALYSSLLQGTKISSALAEAMLTVKHTKHFTHPANWSGYLLFGADVQLVNKVHITGRAIWELLKSPERSRDALRVSLHLIEKSLQRIGNGQKNAMYTTQQSIENKVGNTIGWREILMSVGFRFEPSSNGLPAAVFFPQSDPGERLEKCSANLQALLGLPQNSIRAFGKFLTTPEVGDDVIEILRQSISQLSTQEMEPEKVRLKIKVKLWGIPGCHELLASLGFDLIEVGENEVILGVGKNLNLKVLQLALQVALFLFEALGERASESNSLEMENNGISIESLDLNDHELVVMCQQHNLNSQQPGKLGHHLGHVSAFTSYVRSRGEPDGHTNITGDSNCSGSMKLDFLTNNTQSTTQSGMNKRMAHGTGFRNGLHGAGLKSLIHSTKPTSFHHPNNGIDSTSTSSGSLQSVITDWDNGISTILRRGGPGTIDPEPNNKMGTGFEQSDSESGTSYNHHHRYENLYETKRSGWKPTPSSSENACGGDTGMPQNTSKPWINSKSRKPKHRLHPSLPSSSSRDLGPINDVYNERINLGLDLAPSLSKLLLSQRLVIDDPGTISMDESTLSAFDQLSMCAEEEDDELLDSEDPGTTSGTDRPKSIITGTRRKLATKKLSTTSHFKLPPIPMKRTIKNSTTTIISSSNGTDSSSSKSSPSDLSRRDEGDGRSITDSQCGSYSPSVAAQNEAKAIVATSTPYNHNTSDLQLDLDEEVELQNTNSNSTKTVLQTLSLATNQKSSEC